MRKKPRCLLCPKPKADNSRFCPTCQAQYNLGRNGKSKDKDRIVPEFAVYNGHVAKIVQDSNTGRWGVTRTSITADKLPKKKSWMVLDLNKWVDLDVKVVRRLKARIQEMYEPKLKVVKA